jgi:hypothetical protein
MDLCIGGEARVDARAPEEVEGDDGLGEEPIP